MRGQVRLLVAVVLAATVAACSSNAVPTPTSTEPLVPSGSFVESSAITAPSQAGPTPSVVDPSTFASTSAGGLAVAPLPADLTQEQIAAARAAIEVYQAYWRLSDQASADPGRDWSAQVSEVAAGTSADAFLKELASLSKRGLHTTGRTTIEGTVTKVEPALVYLTGCVDVSSTDPGPSGAPTEVPEASSSPSR